VAGCIGPVGVDGDTGDECASWKYCAFQANGFAHGDDGAEKGASAWTLVVAAALGVGEVELHLRRVHGQASALAALGPCVLVVLDLVVRPPW